MMRPQAARQRVRGESIGDFSLMYASIVAPAARFSSLAVKAKYLRKTSV